VIKFFSILLIATFSLAPLVAFADGSGVLKIVKPSMVSITSHSKDNLTKSGSGVIIGTDEILTNCHVIENVEGIQVAFSDGEKTVATLKGRVSTIDLCVLNATTNKRKVISVVPISEIKVGQTVYAVGDPLSLKTTISDGIISAFRQNGIGKLIQTTAPISPGSSGGGLFDIKGRLLGITTFTLTEGQNLNFAIPAEYWNSLGVNLVQNLKASDSEKSGKAITFKGIPFGASPKQFSEAMTGATCEETPMFYACSGGRISYLNAYSLSYTAFFKNRKFYSILIIFPKSDSYDVVADLKKTLIGYFGQPNGSTQTTWDLNSMQGIVLEDCNESLFCFGKNAATVKITDYALAQEKNNSDF
jgi:Trypsin-like peptidase domain